MRTSCPMSGQPQGQTSGKHISTMAQQCVSINCAIQLQLIEATEWTVFTELTSLDIGLVGARGAGVCGDLTAKQGRKEHRRAPGSQRELTAGPVCCRGTTRGAVATAGIVGVDGRYSLPKKIIQPCAAEMQPQRKWGIGSGGDGEGMDGGRGDKKGTNVSATKSGTST